MQGCMSSRASRYRKKGVPGTTEKRLKKASFDGKISVKFMSFFRLRKSMIN